MITTIYYYVLKKLFSACILAAVTLTASAQYKIVSSESQPGSVSCYEMKYILESESSTFIYGTFTSPKDNGTFAFDQTLAVYQNDLKYKVKNSIHIPVWDEAERMYIVVDATGDKANFVVAGLCSATSRTRRLSTISRNIWLPIRRTVLTFSAARAS